MVKWTKDEVAELMLLTKNNGVAKGFRMHMKAHPNRSYQACSHQYYKTVKALKVGTPISAEKSEATTEKPDKGIITFFRRLFRGF